jgi:hypothetical protein
VIAVGRRSADALVVGTAARLAAAVVVLVALRPSIPLIRATHVGGALAAVVAAIGLGLLLGVLLRQLAGGLDRVGLQRWLSGSLMASSTAVAVLGARALFEEVLWRGPVLVAVHRWPAAVPTVVLVTSAGFAVAHRVGTPARIRFAMLGLALGLLCLLSGGLLAAVVAHTAFNVLWHGSWAGRRRLLAER